MKPGIIRKTKDLESYLLHLGGYQSCLPITIKKNTVSAVLKFIFPM